MGECTLNDAGLWNVDRSIPINRRSKYFYRRIGFKTSLFHFENGTPLITKGRSDEENHPRSYQDESYGSSSSSSTLLYERGGMSLLKLNSKYKRNLFINTYGRYSKSDPLYAKLQEFITQKQSNTFASIAREDTIDDMKTYEKKIRYLRGERRTLEDIPRYLLNGLYFPGESYKTRKYYETLLISTGVEFQHFSGYNIGENVYNFSKMIVKQIIHIEDWGISSMVKGSRALIKSSVITMRDINILGSSRFLDLNKLYQQEPISYLQQIEQICFFIEFSIPLIHKWVPEVDFTEEQIPCLYRTYYNNFWDKLMKKDPINKIHIWTRTLDQIAATIKRI
ncbi:hypothetical protein H5410_015660 [Solanum commersonii]|uniref:Uncharacterized protein n=1 Tax=Solanum commersonii TaxID=4109 RepID=A0A9J5ZV27_SOLCO|nr:hypothetical protein H5410_015660 [Solanum commersonii]